MAENSSPETDKSFQASTPEDTNRTDTPGIPDRAISSMAAVFSESSTIRIGRLATVLRRESFPSTGILLFSPIPRHRKYGIGKKAVKSIAGSLVVRWPGAIPIRYWSIPAICLWLPAAAAAQDLAPEVILLAHLKSHLAEELAQTPNYTCLETVERFHRDLDARSKIHRPYSPLDGLQLEVVYTGHREWYGWPGEGQLNADNPVAFIGAGMIGNGAFAMKLNNILAAASLAYRGEETVNGRKAVRYDFHLPRSMEHFTISIPGGSGTVGEEGSLWADPQSLDLLRLSSRVNEIPAYLPLVESREEITYAPVRLGGRDVMLAQQADLRELESSGSDNFDRLEFTHCRSYSAESEIRFDAEPSTPSQPSPSAGHTGNSLFLPALLLVPIELTTPVSDRDRVGTRIEGKVAADVVRKGQLVVPGGSIVHGRVRRVERYAAGGFIVGIEFTDVVLPGGPQLFYADLLHFDKNPRIKPALTQRVLVPDAGGVRARDDTITLPELPGVASFFVSGTKFMIPAGFRTVWRTRGPIR